MIRVFITDDHEIVRFGLRKIIELEEDMLLVGEAENAEEALKRLSSLEVDVLLLDIRMPGRSGLDILSELKYLQPEMGIIILSMFSEQDVAILALKSGAMGYVSKQSNPNLILQAIRKVAKGQKFISREGAANLEVEDSGESEQVFHKKLTDREYKIMTLVATGHSVQEIATQLSLSKRTVSNYITRILGKLKLPDKAGIIQYAIKYGLLE